MKQLVCINEVDILISDDLVLMAQITEALGIDTEDHVSMIEFKEIREKAIDFTVFGQTGVVAKLVLLPIEDAITWLDLLMEKEFCYGNCREKDTCETDQTTLHQKEFYSFAIEIQEALQAELSHKKVQRPSVWRKLIVRQRPARHNKKGVVR